MSTDFLVALKAKVNAAKYCSAASAKLCKELSDVVESIVSVVSSRLSPTNNSHVDAFDWISGLEKANVSAKRQRFMTGGMAEFGASLGFDPLDVPKRKLVAIKEDNTITLPTTNLKPCAASLDLLAEFDDAKTPEWKANFNALCELQVMFAERIGDAHVCATCRVRQQPTLDVQLFEAVEANQVRVCSVKCYRKAHASICKQFKAACARKLKPEAVSAMAKLASETVEKALAGEAPIAPAPACVPRYKYKTTSLKAHMMLGVLKVEGINVDTAPPSVVVDALEKTVFNPDSVFFVNAPDYILSHIHAHKVAGLKQLCLPVVY